MWGFGKPREVMESAGPAHMTGDTLVTPRGRKLQIEERSNRLGWQWISVTAGDYVIASVLHDPRIPLAPIPRHKRRAPPREAQPEWHFQPFGMARHPDQRSFFTKAEAISAACELADKEAKL